MRNAGASVDPPSDPLAAVPLPTSYLIHGAPKAAEQQSGPSTAPTRGRKLPPGVSPDIFDRPTRPTRGSSSLPPPAPPVQPWVLEGPPERPRAPLLPIPPPSEKLYNIPPTAERPDSAPPAEPRRRRPLRFALILTLLLALVLSLAYFIPATVMSGKVLPGTTVSGVDIGGLTVAQAAERLRVRLDNRAKQPIVVHALGVSREIIPEKAGLSLDALGTVEQAQSGWPSPLEVLRAFTGTTQIPPKVSVDKSKMAAVVQKLAEEIDRPVREGEIRFKGLTPEVVLPRSGRALDIGGTAQLIEEAYFGNNEPVTLPVAVIDPSTDVSVFQEAGAMARKAVSAPFTLVAGPRRAQITRENLAAHLTFVPDSKGTLVPRFDAKGALAEVEKALIDPAKAPVEPTYDVVNGKPRLIPGRDGQGVDEGKLARDISEAILEGGSRTIEVSLTTVKPRLTENEVRSLGIKEKISSFTTEYPCCQPRVTNIHRIADLLDGHLVKPGETFSLNKVVGRRDRARGFVEAPQIVAGRLVNDVGGGISQFVTTMYNAVFFGGLKDVKHTAHEFYISRYPAGRESTVSYPEPDFQWQNDSPYGVLIKTRYTNTSITVEFWSTKRYDKIEAESSGPYNFTNFTKETDSGPDCIPMAGQRGFTIDVTRVFYRDNVEVKRDPPIRTVYRPQVNLTCVEDEDAASSARR